MEYRIYLLNADDHIVRAVDADCHDDDSALGLARAQLVGYAAAEVWALARKVGRLPAPEAASRDVAQQLRTALAQGDPPGLYARPSRADA